MNINQAFDAIQKTAGSRAARIITDNTEHFSKIKMFFLLRKLKRGMPVAKIIHEKWFFGLKFYTNQHTLDPRPDTETLVAAVINDANLSAPVHILDIGTGTGCIIAALVKNIPNTTGVAVDKSRKARKVALRNIKNLGLIKSVKIKAGSFTNQNLFKTEKFDIIVSNPPYIAKGDTRINDGAMHDPAMSLYAKNNGLFAYESVAKNAKNWIKNNGLIYLEIGEGQSLSVQNIFISQGWDFIRAENDFGGIERVLIFKKTS